MKSLIAAAVFLLVGVSRAAAAGDPCEPRRQALAFLFKSSMVGFEPFDALEDARPTVHEDGVRLATRDGGRLTIGVDALKKYGFRPIPYPGGFFALLDVDAAAAGCVFIGNHDGSLSPIRRAAFADAKEYRARQERVRSVLPAN